MTDPQIPYTPPTEPAPAAEPAGEIDFTTHPVWSKALEPIPEILRPTLIETIKTSEYKSQQAIEQARQQAMPEDWRDLYAEAQQEGVSVEDLTRAYVGQNALAELMSTDPDAFVAELKSQIDAMVSSGQLTRAEGRELNAQATAVAAGEQTDDLLTDEQRELAELKKWRQSTEAAQQAEAQRRQQAEQAERIAQEEQRESDAFFDAFDRTMETVGLMTRDPADGTLKSAIPVDTLKLIASTSAQLLEANPRMQREQAITQGTEQVRRMIEATGGKLGPAPRAQVPVMGASNSVPTNQVAEPAAGGPRSMKDRMAAALAEATRLQGEG